MLSLSGTSDGKILAGTDGDGYYIIADGNIVSYYSKGNGLSSDVILKTVPVSDSEWFHEDISRKAFLSICMYYSGGMHHCCAYYIQLLQKYSCSKGASEDRDDL